MLMCTGCPKKMSPRFIQHSNLIFYSIGKDDLIKLGINTNLRMLNPVLNSDFTFCVQGVPKSVPILANMKK